MTQSNNGHTMTTHEALEVLKEHQEWRLGKLYMNATHSEITQALTIAIECMEASQVNIITFLAKCTEGMEAGITKDLTVSDILKMHYNSLTKTPQP